MTSSYNFKLVLWKDKTIQKIKTLENKTVDDIQLIAEELGKAKDISNYDEIYFHNIDDMSNSYQLIFLHTGFVTTKHIDLSEKSDDNVKLIIDITKLKFKVGDKFTGKFAWTSKPDLHILYNGIEIGFVTSSTNKNPFKIWFKLHSDDLKENPGGWGNKSLTVKVNSFDEAKEWIKRNFQTIVNKFDIYGI